MRSDLPAPPGLPAIPASATMKAVLEAVRDFVRHHKLIQSDTRVLAAVSGGSDSVALVHILNALADAGALRLVGIAHFNHQLRSTADRDARFTADIAASLRLPVRPGHMRVR